MAGAGTVRPHAAALLPHSRSVVGRRRAGRRQWTAGWALAGEPRSRRRDTPAATVRGAASTYWHPARLAAAHRRRPSLRRPARERRRRQSAPPAAARRVKFRNDRSERRQHSAHMAPHVDPCTAHVQRNATLGGSWRKLWLYGKGPRGAMRGVNTSTRRTARFFPVTVTVYYELSRARGGRAGERERDSRGRGPAALTAVRELVTCYK